MCSPACVCVYVHAHTWTPACEYIIMFIVQMCGGLCFMIHYSQIICWFMDILPFHFFFFQCLGDLKLGNALNHVKD